MKCLVFMLLVALSSAKFLERCEWARMLKAQGMDGYKGYSISDWLCLTQSESYYNTKATNHDSDGSTCYGIFQVNSYYWCYDGQGHTSNLCRVNCSELLKDDAVAAIKCAKYVVQYHNGMNAWVSWGRHCEGRDLSYFVSGCGV
ncbi:lysozyme C-like [Solea solea]|uniref:lysozyme C-like n=1 Tax=Solea solea TaxID=90069 RepID=UPI00272BE9F3|nr:lysozyme C-like [Solea solea]